MNIQRRSFLKTSLAVSATAALASGAQAASPSGAISGREYYDLRTYRLKPGASRAPLERYLENALLPALDRRGVKPVGVFTELEVDKSAATSRPKPDSAVWVLIPYSSLDTFASVSADIIDDPAVKKAGAGYLDLPKTQPPFDRIDSWLLLAFKSMPKLELPAFSKKKVPTRVFELRTYESYSEAKALKKVAMFDDGETEIMRDLGMSPVFFGQAIAGKNLPHLTYITSGPSLAAHLEAWKKFPPDPRWVKLRDDPQYADTVSKNTPHFLAPTPYSEI